MMVKPKSVAVPSMDPAESAASLASAASASAAPASASPASVISQVHFSVLTSSSHLDNHVPRNILVNKPFDPSSRWSTGSNVAPQFITLKLEQPAILKSITFGKYHKAHVCNLKKFTVLGSMHNNNFQELFSGGLENNGSAETFSLRYTKDGYSFPVEYISIVPQQAWGSSFNYSIWYVELHGITDSQVVSDALFHYNSNAEEKLIKACLKHFRQQGYTEAFKALQHETGIQLEAPQLTQLYTMLVQQGDFNSAEQIINTAKDDGLFEWYVSQKPYTVTWTNLIPCSPDLADRLASGENYSSPGETFTAPFSDTFLSSETNPLIGFRPGQRGGHQMCIDSDTNTIYLFGGWDGVTDLSDLWSYCISTDKWTLLYRYSEKHGGPCPRSCHKMVLHTNKKQIYTLGRYVDVKYRITDMKSDMYMYDIETGVWSLVCEDTATKGGPKLIFDHQMCIDSDNNIIYVFGGRILSCGQSNDDGIYRYSGLYSYNIEQDSWKLLLADDAHPDVNKNTILSRVGHSMLFHPGNSTLYIVGGQRNKDHLVDMLAINITNSGATVQTMCSAISFKRSLPSRFNQRATIDPNLNEIYVLSGFNKDKEKQMSNSLWVFSLTRLQWSCIYKNDNQGREYWSKMHSMEPCPRFAHQLVYDSTTRVHYMFGGNPGCSSQPSLRLDDLWALRLHRVCGSAEWNKAKRLIRKLKFEELACYGQEKQDALHYLRTSLHQIINHDDPEQAKEFQLMTMMLFAENHQTMSYNPPAYLIPKSDQHVRPDPELHEDLEDSLDTQSNVRYPSGSCSEKQQMLFAAVLGMGDQPDTSGNMETSERGHVTLNKEQADKLRLHYRRCQLFQQLTEYFPPHMTQPVNSLTDSIHF